ncbi:MAG: hypothetical protein Kow002_16060 [Anaerolineales bacterium]
MFIVLVGSAFGSLPRSGLPAESQSPPGPDRFSSVILDYTNYIWWMAKWEDSSLVCELEVDHEGPPTLGEVYVNCGEEIYETWVEQKPCLSGDTRTCEGYYFFLIDSFPAQREVTVKLPYAEAFISIDNCEPVESTHTHLCESHPILVITGHEPLPEERITRIAGTVDGVEFACDNPCRLQLAETDEDGVLIEFWVFSSYGDSSEAYTAQARVAKTTEGNPDQTFWYADVLSTQWEGIRVATCADSWEAFPPVGGPPEWLLTPKRPEDLNTEIPYSYLAANLINSGAVNADHCTNRGLSEVGFGANACGLEAAKSATVAWQNRFDRIILDVAHDTGVPAELLKRLFAIESQFWPVPYPDKEDVGLGQLTENGADTTLLWNPSFYEQFCPLVLNSERCAEGYLHLSSEEQRALRLGLVDTVNASCPECPLGIDLARADYSVYVFGQTLLASCEQTGRIVRNVVQKAPGEVSSFEDLWRYTLVNYNAGPGCLYSAICTIEEDGQNPVCKKTGEELNWENVSTDLTGVCSLAAKYVDDISR